ncbi:MAG TPA: hypothetical protein DCS59_07485 [Eubacterium sp.]|nr:hypothetical protein [Eubacterium sp.]
MQEGRLEMQYKCPTCGADMIFNAAGGTLKCSGCGREEQIEGFEQNGEVRQMADIPPRTAVMTDSDQVHIYKCQSCGAEIQTDAQTVATECSFCGSPVILTDRMAGTLRPDYIIPFKIEKREANKAFQEWVAKLKFSPAEFRNMVKVKHVEGLYAPFWIYDVAGQGSARYDCVKEKKHTQGNEEITEESHYDVYREVDLTYAKIPADASQRLDDKLMDIMEPYDYGELKPFSAPYLSGYKAEKYDYQESEVFPRVKKRVEDYMDNYISSTISGYNHESRVEKHYDIKRMETHYTLFPMWINYVKYRDKDYSFAMNGQTGKISGHPPISKGIVSAHIAVITAIIFAILFLLRTFVHLKIHPVAAAVIGLVAALIIVLPQASGAGRKVTVGAKTYLDETRSRIVRRYDRFTHTTTTRRTINK